MKCQNCNREMKEEVIFTSIEYKCSCSQDGWYSSQDILDMLNPMDLPIRLDFKDSDGTKGGVFVNNLEYFTKCPRDRKFKINSPYDMGLKKGMTEIEVAQVLYGYPIDSDDDGC